ncbi:MAG: glycosyltransferase family 4 protein [Calditrichaeota bacterium]|nr:MAG: glycosyltransferase family 4 protein [Calditrichota bacterium]
MKKVRTCIVTGQYPPQVGGVGHSAYRIANLLADRGYEVHVVAFQKHPQPIPFDESFTTTREANVVVHRVKVYYASLADHPGLTESAVLTRYNREMFQALLYFQNRFQYQVLHAFFLYPAGYIAGLVGKLHGVKTIASIRGNDVGKYVFDPIRMPLVRSALQNADYVTSVATNLIELADRGLTPIAGKSRTILNSIDFDRMKVRTRPDYDLRGLVIGTCGLFRYKKGLHYLFKALGRLNGQVEYTLLLAGDFFKEEDKEPHLQDLQQNGLTERTIITGKIPHDQIADYLQLFDILVFPSLYSEGCPLSMLEGMAMQKAIIASRAGAIPEIIQHGENGMLVEPGSAAEIEQAILKLSRDSDLRRKIAANALKTAQTLTLDREHDAWMQVYRTVLSGA